VALGEWLRQVMVETSALKHRASSVAQLMAGRKLVALRLQGPQSVLLIERESLQQDLQFLAGPRPKVTQLFCGNAVDLVLERSKLKQEAEQADVVVAPWKFFQVQDDTLRWSPFVDARLKVAADVDTQIAAVPSLTHQRRLREAARLKRRVSHTRKDFERFVTQLHDGTESRAALLEGFRDGGAVALVEGARTKLLAGALLLTRRRSTLTFAAAQAPTPELYAGLELLAFQHAQALGFALLDFGFSSSVLTEPTFMLRRELGCEITPTPSSPALMLTVKKAARPAFFARVPLLTGEPGAYVAQVGFSRARRAGAKTVQNLVRELGVADWAWLSMSTDAADLPLRSGPPPTPSAATSTGSALSNARRLHD